jgi:hypothetical protein
MIITPHVVDLRMVQARVEEYIEGVMEYEGDDIEGYGVARENLYSEIGHEQWRMNKLDIQLEEEDWDTVPPPSTTTSDFPTTLEEAMIFPHMEPAHLNPSIEIPKGPRAWVSQSPIQPSTRVQSRQWRSPIGQETDRFLTIQTALTKIAPNSPFVPSTLHDWLSHRLAWLEDQTQAAEELLVVLSRQDRNARRPIVGPALRGKAFSDNRSAVLGQETIWCPDEPSRALAPWPSTSEYRWEGDARARSGFHRFPPIPRARGNDTVVWHQKPAADVYEFDRVGSAACMPYGGFGEEEGPLRAFLEEELWRSIALEPVLPTSSSS